MTSGEHSWLLDVAGDAAAANHIWPHMAACEAALESGYGTSLLARSANNIFGMKQHQHPTFGTLVLPTREFESSAWIVVDADWVKYDTLEECFADRMQTLERLALLEGFEHYAAALAAQSAQQYVTEVSQKWSTDPARAAKVLAIYAEAFPQPELGVEESTT